MFMYLLMHKINTFYSVCAGNGHTMSFASSGKNSCILLCKYHGVLVVALVGLLMVAFYLLMAPTRSLSRFDLCFFLITGSPDKHKPRITARCSKVLASTDPLDGSGVLLKNAAPVIKLHKCVAIIITN